MFHVKLTAAAAQAFSTLHPDTKKQLKEALSPLKENPYSGKQLREELAFFRTIKIKRYRIVYQVDDSKKLIIIVAIGHRRDIYEVASKLLKQKK